MDNFDIVFQDNRFLAGFTTRFGGISTGVYESLNLADHVGDSLKCVAKNRQILATRIGVSSKRLKFMSQIHSNRVEILRNFDEKIPPCDGLITNLIGVGLCVLVADCSPVLMLDTNKKVVAAVHAGRAGVVGKICSNAINLMKSEFGCKVSDLQIFIGANIKARNYEIGDLNLGYFNRYKINNKFDMNAALNDEFGALGVKEIKFDERCTFESNELFSYRRDGTTGRFAGVIAIT